MFLHDQVDVIYISFDGTSAVWLHFAVTMLK